MKKVYNSLKRQNSIVSRTLLGTVTQWDSTLQSESEGSGLESHWCAQLNFGTQPHYEAPNDLLVVIEILLQLVLVEWGHFLIRSPKLAFGQPNGWYKKVWTKFTFCFSVFNAVFVKQVNIRCSFGSTLRSTSLCDHNSTNQAIPMDSHQSCFRKHDIFFSRK